MTKPLHVEHSVRSKVVAALLARVPAGPPMTQAERWRNFVDCAERSLPRERLSPLLEMAMGIASLPDIDALMALLRRTGRHDQKPRTRRDAMIHRDSPGQSPMAFRKKIRYL